MRTPHRLYRTRRKYAFLPKGAIYVGRPTIWSNPFSGRPRIGYTRGVILYRAWLDGDLTPHILSAAGFGRHEIEALARWRAQLAPQLRNLRGHNLQCWCPPTSPWCHADVLLDLANAGQPSAIHHRSIAA